MGMKFDQKSATNLCRTQIVLRTAAALASLSMLAAGGVSAQQAPAPVPADQPPAGASPQGAPATAPAPADRRLAGTSAEEAPAPAPADQAAGGTLEEIVVTSEKRKESLQEVPASVTALTSDALEQRGITGVSSLMQGDIPSVRVEPFAGNQTVLQIGMRGFINTNGSDITNENPVPIYVDDVYYGRQNSIALELNDLQRIEVLRGPQGTLFGKNAEGGALRLISKEPTGELGLDLKAETGNFGYWKGVGHINLPSVAGIAAKVDVLATSNDGWTTNPAQYNYGITKSQAGKLTLLYEPGGATHIEYAGDYTDLQSTEAWNAQLSAQNPYSTVWPNQTTTPTSEPLATYRPLDHQIYWGHRLNVDFKLNDSVTLKSITAFRQDNATLNNTSATAAVVPGPFFLGARCASVPTPFLCTAALTDPIPLYVISHHQVSEEVQLIGKQGKLDWVAGLYYIHEAGSQIENTYFGTVLPGVVNLANSASFFVPLSAPTSSAVLSPLFGPVGTAGADITESSKAAFGQVTYRPNDAWALTAGLRVGEDTKAAVRPAIGGQVWARVTYPAFPNGPAPNGMNCPGSPLCSPSVSNTHVSPLAAIDYRWTKDISTYARFSTGYQSNAQGVGSQTFKFVDPSSVNAYEAGLKSELDDRKVRLNVAAFYENWMKPQEGVQTVSSSTVEYFNGPNIHIYGMELDSTWAPVHGLTFNGALSLLHGSQASVANPFPAPAGSGFPTVSANSHLVNLPHWAASVAVNYDFAHTSYGIWRTSIQANGTDSYYSVPNVDTKIDGYWLLDGRLALTDINLGSSGRLEVALWGKNLTNKSYNTFVYAVQGPNVDGTFGTPRTYGGSLTYKFD
jgi:iron complex outermembrane recepter protein